MSQVKNLAHAKVIITSWQSQGGIKAYCSHCQGTLTMLPMAEIEENSSGFKIKLCWTCSGCGRRKGA